MSLTLDTAAQAHARELQPIVDAILREYRRRTFDAVRSLWRTGDEVRRLRDSSQAGGWGRELRRCARQLGVHPAWLEEAARASDAFRSLQREPLLRRFEQAGVPLTPSHIVELARNPPSKRTNGIEMLLQFPHSIRELRNCIRAGRCDGHKIADTAL